MKIRFIFLYGILLIALAFLSSCDKEDECKLENEDIELKPCDTSGIDLEIKLDTIWKKPITIIYPDNLKFSDKYIIVYNDYKEYEFYSIEDGTKKREVNENTVPEFDGYHFKVKGDYLFGYTNIKGSSKIYVYRFNIATGDLKSTDSLDWCRAVAYEEDCFYYANDDFIIKTDYDLTTRDTIYKFQEKFSNKVNMEIYEYPSPLSKKYIVMTYSLIDYYNFHMGLIDINSKKLERDINLGGIYSSFDILIDKGMVNISKRDMIFSYDLKNLEYFSFHSNYYNTAKIYSIPYRQTKDEDKYPVVFFDRPGQFSAYDLHYGKILWSCDLNLDNQGLKSLYPVDLSDEFGNVYTCMTYVRGATEMGLLDPYTGIVKTKFPKAGYLNVSPVFDKNNIFFWNKTEIVKVKIRKK